MKRGGLRNIAKLRGYCVIGKTGRTEWVRPLLASCGSLHLDGRPTDDLLIFSPMLSESPQGHVLLPHHGLRGRRFSVGASAVGSPGEFIDASIEAASGFGNSSSA